MDDARDLLWTWSAFSRFVKGDRAPPCLKSFCEGMEREDAMARWMHAQIRNALEWGADPDATLNNLERIMEEGFTDLTFELVRAEITDPENGPPIFPERNMKILTRIYDRRPAEVPDDETRTAIRNRRTKR